MAAQTKLELRDLEILRALLRVRYLTTRQINGAFFSCPRVGRRRIHRLSEYDLIRPHTKGMEPELRYTAWRLTSRGLDAVVHAFPDEPVPDGLIERVSTGSLYHAQHREALADLYLALTIPDRASLAERDLKAHRRWVADVRARASAITWAPDGDVVLSVSELGQRTDVVPDAVVRSAAGGRRVFVELDRSNKDLGRIRECLERYATALRSTDLGSDAVTVLFVVRSAARKANIEQLARQTFLEPFPLVVLQAGEAAEWLRVELLSVATPPKPTREQALWTVARRAYSWMAKLRSVMEANGMHTTLVGAEPALMKDGHERLISLYHAVKAPDAEGAA
jgi:hypothetical protein